MNTGLEGRVAVVTGATSGIGRATARALGRERARVAITYHSRADAARETAALVEAGGGEALVAPLTLEDPDSIEAAFAAVVERWGAIDVLVANAVQWPTERASEGRAEALPLAAWQRSLRTNVEGTVASVNAALPALRESPAGRIVIVSSGVGEEGLPGPNPYGVGKAALHGLMRQLAWDVGRDGILVNAIATGFTVTERNREAFTDSLRERVAAQIPSRRLSSPDDVASLIVFLGSEANGNLTGELIAEGSSTGRSAHVAAVPA